MKPILFNLFNTEMVKGLLSGQKTVTRRVVKPQPKYQLKMHDEGYHKGEWHEYSEEPMADKFCNRPWGPRYPSPYRPGDILYVRETWQYAYDLNEYDRVIEETGRYLYAADGNNPSYNYWVMPDGTYRDSMPWRPSIHMPKEAARIFLRVTDVRVERLQDMRLADFLAEGVRLTSAEKWDCIHGPLRAMERYAGVWDTTIKPKDLPLYGWEANPWVWVIEFERVSKPIP